MKVNQPGYKLASLVFLILCSTNTVAQQAIPAIKGTSEPVKSYAPPPPAASSETSERERMLLDRIERLEQRLAELESRDATRTNATAASGKGDVSPVSAAKTGEAAKDVGSSQTVALGSTAPTTETVSAAGSNGVGAQDLLKFERRFTIALLVKL